MSWVEPKFSRSQIDKAGQILAAHMSASRFELSDELDQTLEIVNNWRSSHGHPLHVMRATLFSRARRLQEDAIVAQRLKRLSSIALKLSRHRSMRFSRMQDIGGCRAILDDIKDVAKLTAIYARGSEESPLRPLVVRPFDYINNPKPDGYRSYHMVVKYWSSLPRYEIYNGLCVEIQVRSRLQHAWATAVETVSTFTDQDLKSGIGDESWKRLFALMGTVIAQQENTAPIEGTPTDPKALKAKLDELVRETGVIAKLDGWRRALQVIGSDRSAGQYLLVLDLKRGEVRIRPYDKRHTPEVAEEYLAAEKEARANTNLQAVLVSTNSAAALKSAYPNYYLDMSAFLDIVKKAIA